MPLALLALAISAFAIGTTEFVTTGLLQDIANDLHVSIPQAGYLTSGYAMGVVISAPILTILLSRFNRKHTLVFLILLFIIGSVISAQSSNFALTDYWSCLICILSWRFFWDRCRSCHYRSCPK